MQPVRQPARSDFLIAFALQAPLLAELARRLINPSALWLAASDFLVVAVCFYVVRANFVRLWGVQAVSLAALVLFAALSVMLNDLPPPLIYVGVRPFVMGFLSMLLGYQLLRLHRDFRPFIWMVVFWSVLIAGYALLQIILGIDHPINELPEGVANNFGEGIGGYAEEGTSLFGFFRPTSIFFHTGKFGQVAFFMALVPTLLFLAGIGTRSQSLRVLVLLGWAALLISGQRAALVAIVFFIAIFLLRTGRGLAVVRAVFVGATILLLIELIGGGDLSRAIAERYSGMWEEGQSRFFEQSSPLGLILNNSGLMGQGVGIYSFGADAFIERLEFITEHGWLRILAEWGVAGMLLVLVFFASTLYAALQRAQGKARNALKDVLRFSALSIAASLSVWAFTHDLFANTLTMQLAFSALGAARGHDSGIGRATA